MKLNLFTKIACLACFSFSVHARPLIVLDTGHTPEVPGVISANNTPEFEYNRNFVQSLIPELKSLGWDVYDVRAEGGDNNLVSRTLHTNSATLFLAIHHDSMQQAWLDAGYKNNYKGYSIFVSRKNKEFDKSKKCASSIGESLRKAGEQPSLYHSADYPGEKKQLVDSLNGVHIYDNLVVLKHSSSPAVLLEVGVVVNDYEASRLQQKETISQLTKYVANGLERCK